MRVMFDTNILVSAFVFRSRKIYAVIDYIVSHHELVEPPQQDVIPHPLCFAV